MKKTAAGKNPTHIKDLVSDPKNARRHNPRNIGVVADSLNAVGAARSIVVDENNVVMAGNGVLEAAAQAGITKLQIVEADGETIIAVKRRGLTKKQKIQLAIADNRANELSEWEPDVLADLLKDLDAEDLQKLALTDADLKAMDLDMAEKKSGENQDQNGINYVPQFGVIVICENEQTQQAAYEKLLALGYNCKVVVT